MRLTARNLDVEIAGNTILDGADFTLDDKKLVALIGPNGSGKTSLIQTLSGELTPSAGEVYLDGKELSRWKPADRATTMAVLFQQTPVNFDISVEQLVRLGRHPYPYQKQKNREIIDDVMDCMGLTLMAQRSFLSLSGGEQQRVQIARVLAQIWKIEPKMDGVLMLDEPLAALDIVYQYQQYQHYL